jgi:succinate dehydrogenase / fumarate reductase, membrane anchor subunit
MSVNYGSKRLVVGAHYGLRDWMVQRATGVLMALFTVVLLAQLLFTSQAMGYELWAGIFAKQWMKVLTFTLIVSLIWHAWVGMRDIWMDYVTASVAWRLVLQVFTLAWLVGCAGWAIQVLWRL